MAKLLSNNTVHIFRFDKGDDVIHGLTTFCVREKIGAGFFTGLGACQSVTIAYYDLVEKQYLDNTIAEDLEIVSLTGNIALLDAKPIIHAHGVFSDSRYQTYGGHVKKLTVSATCEVHLTAIKAKLERTFDSVTGLNLLNDN